MEKFPFSIKEGEESKLPVEEDIWNGKLNSNEEDFYNLEHRGEGQLNRFVANGTRPGLFSYPAKDGNGLGVIVCPGGGYHGQAIDKEGHDIARFLNSFGVSAFVLKYRVPVVDEKRVCEPGPFWGAMEDVARTMRLVRSKAAEYGIKKLGVMGFSAGGHLAGMVSTTPDAVKEECQCLAKYSARPDFTILLYSVSSVYEYAHIGSRDALLGVNPSLELKRLFSPISQITENTPPCFLAQAEDDMVDINNSIGYFLACREKGVKAEMHLYPEGDHGYGMYQRGIGIDTWNQRMKEWLLRMV